MTIAKGVTRLLSNPALDGGHAKRAWKLGREMTGVVAVVTGKLSARARAFDAPPRKSFAVRTLKIALMNSPLKLITFFDTYNTGIFQHASFNVPHYRKGIAPMTCARLYLTLLLPR